MTASDARGRLIVRQLVRYGTVGLAINAVGYLAYLGLTALSTAPKVAVTVLYPVAVAVGFVANRNLTFGHGGRSGAAAVRFVTVQVTGYLLNLAILEVGVDRSGYPHQLVQALAIFIVAAFLFVAMKFFVFRSTTEASG